MSPLSLKAVLVKRPGGYVMFTENGSGHPAFIGGQFDALRMANKHGFKLINFNSPKATEILTKNGVRL